MSNNGAVKWPQCYEIAESETRGLKCSFLDELPSGVLLTGTPTATEITSTDLTIANVALNSSSVTIDGTAHAANTAVTFTVTGVTPGALYRIRVTAGTDGTPAETMAGIAECVGVDDGS